MADRIKFSVKKNNNFYLNDSDREVLLFLYMPVVGSKAYIIYNLFYSLTLATGSFIGDPLLLIDFLSDLNVTDKELNDSLKILRDFKLLKIESKTEFIIYRPMSKEKFRESLAYPELLDNISSVEKKIILDKFGFTKATLDYKHLEYSRDKKTTREFDIERFKVDSKEAGYSVLDSDLVRIESMAKTYSLSCDDCLRLLYESSEEDNKYNVDEMIAIESKLYLEKYEKIKRNNSLKEVNDDEHITFFKKTKPLDLLKENYKGEVPESDQSIVKKLKDNFLMNDELISLLLAYSLATKEGRIRPYSFFEKIALDWRKNNIKTVEDAYYYITDLYSNSSKGSKKTKETTEEWFDNYWSSYMSEKEDKK